MEQQHQESQGKKPDVVILDVQMPVKDGFQAFYELRHDAATKSMPSSCSPP